jgi:hypothetical protein
VLEHGIMEQSVSSHHFIPDVQSIRNTTYNCDKAICQVLMVFLVWTHLPTLLMLQQQIERLD